MVALTSRDPRTRSRLRAMVEENRGVFLMQHWPSEPLRPATFERLRELRPPTLFIVGDRDTPVVRRVAQRSAARVPHAQWAQIERADHLPHMVRPGAFNALLRWFLQAP